MSSPNSASDLEQYNVLDPASHSLYECRTADEFRTRFEETTGRPVQHVADLILKRAAPRAIFCVGSIPLGMGTRGSDIDIIVLVDGRDSLSETDERPLNNTRTASFSNDADQLIASTVMQLQQGVLVEVQVAVTSAIRAVYTRLRRRSPELAETEIRILGRLRSGWLLWESDEYVERSHLNLTDQTLSIYCCTRNFVTALTHQRKATKTLELKDLALTLHLGRACVEMAYLAYFASEGFVYLGVKWLAQLGFARDAPSRLARHPLLKEKIYLLFPSYESREEYATQYLAEVSEFLDSIRGLIEEKTIFRIAFKACVQIAVS